MSCRRISHFFCVLSLISLASAEAKRHAWPTFRESGWATFHYDLSSGAPPKDFYADVSLAPNGHLKKVRFRIAFCVQDEENYYFVGLEHGKVSIGKVELGFESSSSPPARISSKTRPPLELRLIKRGPRVSVTVNGEVVVSATDETFETGKIGIGMANTEARILSSHLRPLPETFFEDDFMRAGEEEGPWGTVSGKWKLSSIENGLRSVNAFYFKGIADGGPAITVTGHLTWSDYVYQLACLPQDTGPVGLVFGFVDASNYFLFRWEGGASGKRSLLSLRDGKRELLWESPGGFLPGVWVQLRLRLYGKFCEVAVDGHSLVRIRLPVERPGKAGVYTESKKGCLFDDVRVGPNRSAKILFRGTNLSDWQELGGVWKVQRVRTEHFRGLLAREAPRVTSRYALHGKSQSSGKLLLVRPGLADYEVSARLAPDFRGAAGLVCSYQDEANYYLVKVAHGGGPDGQDEVALSKVSDGGARWLASSRGTMSATVGLPLDIKVRARRGIVTVFFNGLPVVYAADNEIRSGRAGLWLGENSNALFEEFAFRALPPESPAFRTQKLFSKEESMSNWADPVSNWEVKEDPGEKTWWHQMDFKGDAAIHMQVKMKKRPGAAGLILGAAENLQHGYRLVLGPSSSPALSLANDGRLLASKKLPADLAVHRITLRRVGKLIVGSVNDAPALAVKASSSPAGEKAGWFAPDSVATYEEIEFFTDNVRSYVFETAPVDWRAAGGDWKVTNRWQCDPRWSWFSGLSKQGVAALWNKRLFEGDLTIECVAGVKMDRTQGSYGAYARDLNLTICGDGEHLDSGYTFTFGGWGNSKTAILRGRKILVEAPKPLISGALHHKWFKFRIEKRGGQLRYLIDNQQILECEDPLPLKGRQVAIWTYHSGIMVSRFRASSLSGHVTEMPSAHSLAEATTYYAQ